MAMLLAVFCLLISSINITVFDSLDSYVDSMDSNTEQELSVKIHKPGALFNDEQSLVWSPNNITEHREMQISVHAAHINQIDQLAEINLRLTFNGDNQDITYQEITTTDYQTNADNSGIVIFTLFSYNKDIWGGNYTLSVKLNLSDGASLTGNSSQVVFKEQDYFISMNGNETEHFVCDCKVTRFNLTIQNTGSSETLFQLSVSHSYVEYKPFSLTLSSATGEEGEFEDEVILLDGGESFTVFINLIPNNGLLPNSSYSIRPLDINIVYEDDNDEMTNLYDGVPIFTLFSLPQYSNPEAVVTLNDFDYENNFAGSPNFIDSNETVYTMGKEYFLLHYEVSNRAFRASEILLQSDSAISDLRIGYNGLNLTLSQFNEMGNLVGQNEKIAFDVHLRIEPLLTDLLFELEIIFASTYTTHTAIRFSYSPVGDNKVMSIANDMLIFDSRDEIKTVQLNIDSSFMANLTYFANYWTLYCVSSYWITISISNLDNSCNEDMIDLPINVNSSYDFEIGVANWDFGTTQEIQIILLHTPSRMLNNTSEIVQLSLRLNQSQDNDTQTDIGSENNSTIIDNNQPNLDVDNDGILDSQDACLDSNPEAIVDDFGCAVTEQTSDNEQQGNEMATSKSSENNFVLYTVIGVIIIILSGGLILFRNKNPRNEGDYTATGAAEPILPLPAMPLPALEPVVLQQWTDGNGHSWRQMSDQTIMWWNGTDWIPYGKK